MPTRRGFFGVIAAVVVGAQLPKAPPVFSAPYARTTIPLTPLRDIKALITYQTGRRDLIPATRDADGNLRALLEPRHTEGAFDIEFIDTLGPL